MNARDITPEEFDRAIYGTQSSMAIVLVPRSRGRSNPVQTPNIIYMPAKAGKLPVKRQSGDVIVVTERGSNLVFAENEDALATAIPHSSLEPVPPPYVLTTPVLPIDEKPIPVACPPIINHAEAAKSLSIPKLTRQPVRLPVGQRMLAPTNCWYGNGQFWYRFEVMPDVIVGFSEAALIAANEGSVRK